MDLLTMMWKVAFSVGGIISVFFGAVFILSALFLTKEKLANRGVRGIKTKHRVVGFILGYLLLCLGVFLISLLF